MAIPEVDFTDEIAMRLQAIMQEYLPDELEEALVDLPGVDVAPKPIENWFQGSHVLYHEPKLLPCVTISDEPPGGFVGIPAGIGVDTKTGMMAVDGRYTFFIYYVTEFKGTELSHRIVRKAAATIAKVQIRRALWDNVVGWKEGWAGDTSAGAVLGIGKQANKIFCIGQCTFKCSKVVTGGSTVSRLGPLPPPFPVEL